MIVWLGNEVPEWFLTPRKLPKTLGDHIRKNACFVPFLFLAPRGLMSKFQEFEDPGRV